MGQKDTVTKDYIRNAEVFADAFNYLFYGGEKVIIPESFMSWIQQQLLLFMMIV